MRMTNEQFDEAIREAMASIPAHVLNYLENVVIDVEGRPTPETARELGVEDPREVFGAYFGTPLTSRSVEDAPPADRIVIYKQNVEEACASRSEIVEEIAVTVLHEIGHHFGLDEDDLDDLGYG
jgi:predicted Zn-dependent protease with MMP-like domain